MFNMILYILIAYFIILNVYIGLSSTFWGLQPVFHVYDIHYWLYPIGIIQRYIGNKNKYVDEINIKTTDTRKCSYTLMSDVSKFITDNFLEPHDFKYAPSPRTLKKMLYSRGNDTSYISVLRDDIDICSVITSSSYIIYIDGGTRINTHYVDHLCVRSDMRKRNVAPKTISTLIYNMCKCEEVGTFLFKREGELTGIVPLTVFNLSSYVVSDIIHLSRENPYKTNRFYADDIISLTNIIENTIRNLMDVLVVPSSSKLVSLLKSDIFMIYEIRDDDDIFMGLYVFKKTSVSHLDGFTAECILAFNNNMKTCDFANTFVTLMKDISKEFNICYITIDELCHGSDITANLVEYKDDTCISAYFMYNYATYTKPARRCGILC